MPCLNESILVQNITKASVGAPNASNLKSVVLGLVEFGAATGLDRPHRIAQYIAQLMHESGEFRYDREIWDGKGAQARYDIRTDLGNTPARDGDGKRFRGRTAIQVTGGSNYRLVTAWVQKIDSKAPDFFKNPDLLNTDPWEGMAPIWFWSTNKLNRYADDGRALMITKRINGGTNGLEDRLKCLTRISLVMLGYNPTDVRRFQDDSGLVADGISGPNTRAALHNALVDLK